jgi:hypothetical protein
MADGVASAWARARGQRLPEEAERMAIVAETLYREEKLDVNEIACVCASPRLRSTNTYATGASPFIAIERLINLLERFLLS